MKFMSYLKKTYLSMALIIMFFSSCCLKENKSDKILTNAEPGYLILEDSIIAIGNEFNPKISYKFNLDKANHILKSIFIYSDLKKIQEIIVNKDINELKVKFIDWDFDGYKDISVLSNSGSGGCEYLIWNYSKINGGYSYNKELSEVLGLEIDSISKFIIFHYRAGWQEEHWDSLKYVNSKLTLIKAVTQEKWNDPKGNSWIKRTSTKLLNSTLITTKDSSIIK